MRTRWRYDDTADLGPATAAVCAIVASWLDIDWFIEPSPDALERARAAFEEHIARTRPHARRGYAPDVRIISQIGSWAGGSLLGATRYRAYAPATPDTLVFERRADLGSCFGMDCAAGGAGTTRLHAAYDDPLQAGLH